MEVVEKKMLRFSLVMMRMDKIGNEIIRGTARVERLGDEVRETRLRLDMSRGGIVGISVE